MWNVCKPAGNSEHFGVRNRLLNSNASVAQWKQAVNVKRFTDFHTLTLLSGCWGICSKEIQGNKYRNVLRGYFYPGEPGDDLNVCLQGNSKEITVYS